MERKIYFALLTLIIIVVVIATGCGGNGTDSTIQPQAINNQELTNEITGSNGGYITIQVIWPQGGVPGKFIISSEDEKKTLTASMPYGTTSVKVTVREEGADPNDLLHIGGDVTKPAQAIINWLLGEDRATIGPLPAVRAIVSALPYDAKGVPIYDEPVEVPVQIEVGMNPVNLYLGDKELAITARPITLEGFTPVISSGETRDIPPLKKSETYITAKFAVVFPNPTTTPTPYPTIVPKENNLISSQDPIGLEGYDITFSIVSGYGALSPDGVTYYKRGTSPVTVTTDENGECSLILRADTGLDIWLLVEYYFDPADPASKIEEYYFVEVLGSYNFLSPVGYPPQIYYDDPARNTALILEKLIVEYPETGEASKAVPDRKITFEITDPPEAASFLWPPPLYRYTDENGECNINFTIMENAEVWISCRFPIYPDDPYSPAYSWYMLWYPGGVSPKSSEEEENAAWIYKCEKAEWIEQEDEFNPTTLK